MTRAPNITNNTLSRRRHHLRTDHHTLIKLSTRQKLMTPTKYRGYQPKVGKADATLRPARPANLDRQTGARTKAPLKSP